MRGRFTQAHLHLLQANFPFLLIYSLFPFFPFICDCLYLRVYLSVSISLSFSPSLFLSFSLSFSLSYSSLLFPSWGHLIQPPHHHHPTPSSSREIGRLRFNHLLPLFLLLPPLPPHLPLPPLPFLSALHPEISANKLQMGKFGPK